MDHNYAFPTCHLEGLFSCQFRQRHWCGLSMIYVCEERWWRGVCKQHMKVRKVYASVKRNAHGPR